jgi:hypothetical protein
MAADNKVTLPLVSNSLSRRASGIRLLRKVYIR